MVPVKAVKRQQNSCIDLVCQATHFSGDIAELTPRAQKFKEFPLLFNVAIEGTSSHPSVSDMLKETYPQARLLYDFAKHSSDLHGLAPLPLRLQNQPASFSQDFANLAREFEDLPNRFLQALSEELAPAPPLNMNQGEPSDSANDRAPGPLPALRQEVNDNVASSSGISPQSDGPQTGINGPRTRAKARRAGHVRVNAVKCPAKGTHFITPCNTLNSPTITAFSANYFDVEPPTFAHELPTMRQAMESPLWKAAIDKETQGIMSSGAIRDATYSDLPPGNTPMPCHFVFDIRANPSALKSREKARLVIDGNRQRPAPTKDVTYASTPSATAIRCLIAMAAAEGKKLRKFDFTQAFLQSDDLSNNENLFVIPPAHLTTSPDHLWRLIKAVYGTGQASRAWQKTLAKFLKSTGWTEAAHEQCYWMKRHAGKTIRAVIHVDDVLCFGSDDACVDDFFNSLLTKFKGGEELASSYVGLQIDDTADNILLHQRDFIDQLLETYGLRDCNAVYPPLQSGLHLTHDDCPPVPDEKIRKPFREMVGCLQYLAHWTRPDIAHTCTQLAKFSENPAPAHLDSAKRVLRYLKGTRDYAIVYPKHKGDVQLWGAVDSDWASCPITRRSYTGYVFHLQGGAIGWSSKQQSLVAKSTPEAEFIAASAAAREVDWLRRLLNDWDFPQLSPTILYEDNQGCIAMSLTSGQTTRTKHVDLRIHDLKEHVENKVISLMHCPSALNPADLLTKCLPKDPHHGHTNVLLGVSPCLGPTLPT